MEVKRLLCSEWARRIYSVLIIFFALFCAYPSRFFLGTLALPVLAGLAVAFFYDELLFCIPAAALSALILSLVEYRTAREILLSALILTLLFALSMVAARGIKRLFVRRCALWGVAGIIGALLLFAAYFFCFGNPVSLFAAQRDAMAHLAQTYPQEEFSLVGTYYNNRTKSYVTGVTYTAGGVTYAATVDAARTGGDDYFDDLRDAAAEAQREKLLDLLHERFSDGLYHIRVSARAVEKPAVVPYTVGDNPIPWQAKYDYTLEFASAIDVTSPQARARFAERVSRYAEALSDAEFPYASMVFRGGEQETMRFEIAISPQTLPESIDAHAVVDLGA